MIFFLRRILFHSEHDTDGLKFKFKITTDTKMNICRLTVVPDISCIPRCLWFLNEANIIFTDYSLCRNYRNYET